MESGALSDLFGNLLDSYHASGLEPFIFSPSQVVRDLVEPDTVSDLTALMSCSELENVNSLRNVTEFLLADLNISFPYSLKCLKHPDLWIGDTGTSMHTTRFKTHGFNFVLELQV